MAVKKKTAKKKVAKKKGKHGGSGNTTSKAHSKHLERQEQALQFRIVGLSYSKIGKQMDISKSAAHKLVVAALADSASRVDKGADDLRDLELERLDKLLVAVWPKALKGSTQHSAQALKIMEQRQKLTGIQAAPQVLGEIIAETGSTDKPSLRVRVTYVDAKPRED